MILRGKAGRLTNPGKPRFCRGIPKVEDVEKTACARIPPVLARRNRHTERLSPALRLLKDLDPAKLEGFSMSVKEHRVRRHIPVTLREERYIIVAGERRYHTFFRHALSLFS